VDDVAKVGAAEDDAEGAEDLGTLRGNDPSHHGEHADGAERNDEGHHALDDRVEGGDHILRELALFSCREDAAAEKNEANYKAAKERCDAMSGDLKSKCVDDAKRMYGQH
jgi:hypothetical protein